MTEEGLHPSALGPSPGEITAASSIQRATGLAFPKLLLLLETDVRTRGSGDPLSRRPENPSQRGTCAAWYVTSPPHPPAALLQPPWGEGAMGGHGGQPPSTPLAASAPPCSSGGPRAGRGLVPGHRLGVCSFHFSFSCSELREATAGDEHCHLAKASVPLGLSRREKTQLKPLGLANFMFFLFPIISLSLVTVCVSAQPVV